MFYYVTGAGNVCKYVLVCVVYVAFFYAPQSCWMCEEDLCKKKERKWEKEPISAVFSYVNLEETLLRGKWKKMASRQGEDEKRGKEVKMSCLFLTWVWNNKNGGLGFNISTSLPRSLVVWPVLPVPLGLIKRTGGSTESWGGGGFMISGQ